MEILPIEIFGKIFNTIFKERDFNIKDFFQLQSLSKYFYCSVNSPYILKNICKIKNINYSKIKSLSNSELKSLIIHRLYLHKFNIGRQWLPNNMVRQPVDFYDFNQNSCVTTKFDGIFEKVEIKDKNDNIILSVSNKENDLFNLSVKVERHELFDDVYEVHFYLNDNAQSIFWTNLNDYKIKILGIVY